MDSKDFDLRDPDTFAFDESPDDFVVFGASGIVFTVRGIAHFTPRFKAMGFDIGLLKTREEFEAAYSAWCTLEVQLLTDSIATKAQATHQPNEHKVLLAAITQGFEAAQHEAGRLLHKGRANLKSVKP